MSAITAWFEPERARLWGRSAFAVLLAHLAAITLLFLQIQERPPPPLAGSPIALDVQLASLPASSPFAASSPRRVPSQPQQQPPSRRPQLATAAPVRPLAKMQSLAQEVAPAPPNAAAAANAGATSAPAGLSGLGTSNMTEQLWLSEVKARLESFKEYPSSAIAAMQQDTVMLQFSVDRAGKVTSSRIDSAHHYQALEQEAQQMLRLADPLPALPPQLHLEGSVITVPVQFALSFRYCNGSHCQTVSAPLANAGKGKLKAMPAAAPALTDCVAPATPAPAPAGATATPEQMQAYRERLNQYLVAGGNQLGCLSQVPGAIAADSRKNLAQQLHALVANFNAQAQLFESHAQAQALQARQTRQRQLQALAAQAYGVCKRPTAPRAPGSALTTQVRSVPRFGLVITQEVVDQSSAQSYRRELVSYQSAVRTYVACLRQAAVAGSAPERGLGSDQRAQLDQTGAHLGNAAIESFNQLVAGFNAQVPHLHQQALAAQALAAQAQTLAEVNVRGAAIFPNSTWSVPAPLPANECIYITRFGQTYHAQLCNPTYVTRASGLSQILKSKPLAGDSMDVRVQKIEANRIADQMADPAMAKATQQEAIAALHGFPHSECGHPPCGQPILGIAATTEHGVQLQQGTAPPLQTTSYSVSELQIAGRHLSLTIGGKSDNAAGGVDLSTMHFDLVLSPDNQTLHGYCWTQLPGGGQQRQDCVLRRHD